MELVNVTSLDDGRLDPYARLTDVQLRSRIEPERAVFIAESLEVIGRALDAGMQPLSLLTAPKYLPQLEAANILGRMDRASSRGSVQGEEKSQTNGNSSVPLFVAPEEELAKLTGFELTRGALAAFRRPPERPVEEVVRGARLVAVLEDIRNHTNVGSVFRAAAGLGVDAVLVSPACYDPLYRRAVRVSMGTVFQIPWTRIGSDPHDWAAEGVPLLHDLGFTTAAMALSPDAITLDDQRLRSAGRLALVFGTEGDGLARATLSRCDYTVRIPMAHGVDSLNVASSAAVAFWELRSRG